ncbi:hypothetical protein RFI_24146 [Reticulomyxa filosa]|uniref:Sulfhydryl oxidase n=1 Tax=Reticulomyxa filosa TaxID=46433 RepID=X6MGT4_RETFI|nr:hypothetical protein RFI_24146 [Reticulomyxa filosa]|eukprot:ETO13228.1 hypothetical protein RFI_24146 [Reticulomyxa filosa]
MDPTKVSSSIGTTLPKVNDPKKGKEEDCHSPICEDAGNAIDAYRGWYENTMNKGNKDKSKNSSNDTSNNDSKNDNNGSSNTKNKTSFHMFVPMAPDRQQLGRHTWTLLHTQSVYYPEKPTDEEKQDMNTFLHVLAKVYPCKVCGADLQYLLEQYPPQLDSRNDFAYYMCVIHNKVNQQLNKPSFDCSLDSIYKRWRRDYTDDRHDIQEPNLDE